MADHRIPIHHHQQITPITTTISNATSSLFRTLHSHAPDSTLGFLTLFTTATILLFLAGVSITATVLTLILFSPFIVISSPVWLPLAAVLFLSVVGFLSVCGFCVAAVGGSSWVYRYYRGMNPVGSDRFDYARSRISDTASHVKDYARDFGYLQSNKMKDAAPGA